MMQMLLWMTIAFCWMTVGLACRCLQPTPAVTDYCQKDIVTNCFAEDLWLCTGQMRHRGFTLLKWTRFSGHGIEWTTVHFTVLRKQAVEQSRHQPAEVATNLLRTAVYFDKQLQPSCCTKVMTTTSASRDRTIEENNSQLTQMLLWMTIAFCWMTVGLACDCMPHREDNYCNSDVVFRGEAVAEHLGETSEPYPWEIRIYTVNVEEIFWSNSSFVGMTTFNLTTQRSSAMCGVRFSLNTAYVIADTWEPCLSGDCVAMVTVAWSPPCPHSVYWLQQLGNNFIKSL
ncbi:hypothetical protein C0Q70_06274 [Pomacea canaliculata]|uniref:NTR domain-containing protein n=1 Tax=Pomacea canaliculata TaxID=400727 RepID=A0A2T7PNJ3_POMCA|nr:hypothetical protein C0Q70_06274 [Pomacea canaliculata]